MRVTSCPTQGFIGSGPPRHSTTIAMRPRGLFLCASWQKANLVRLKTWRRNLRKLRPRGGAKKLEKLGLFWGLLGGPLRSPTLAVATAASQPRTDLQYGQRVRSAVAQSSGLPSNLQLRVRGRTHLLNHETSRPPAGSRTRFDWPPSGHRAP
jgi:hypothetical protein